MLPISVLDPVTPAAANNSPFLAAASSFATPNSASTAGTSGSSSSSSSSSSSGPDNQLTGNDFITLLAAQLQAQDPLNPIDPTTFVTQLVQFNQLEQLININQTLSGVAGATTSSATQAVQSSPPVQSNQSLATAAYAGAATRKVL
jgi:flagellar basal-body rod modification protein FlgD